MLELIKKNEKRIITGSVIVYIALWIFVFNSEPVWVTGFLPFFVIVAIIVNGIIANKSDKETFDYYDLKEFNDHKPFSIDSLEEVFNDEPPESEFSLQVVLSGEMRGEEKNNRETAGLKDKKPGMRGPLSGNECIAYRLTVGCVKPKDISSRTGQKATTVAPGTKDKYSFFLLTEQEGSLLKLVQEKNSITVGNEGIYNFAAISEEVVTWKQLSKLGSRLEGEINDAIALKKIAKTDYTGVKIREEILSHGEVCTVYGTCRKKGGTIVIEGTGKVDDPDSLYITTLAVKDREEIVRSLKRSIMTRRIVTSVIVLMLAGICFFKLISNFFIEQGIVFFETPKTERILELEKTEPVEILNWTFPASIKREMLKLTSNGDKDIRAKKDAEITLFSVSREKNDYTVGKDKTIEWQGAFWQMKLEDNLPQNTLAEYRKGRIYIKNKTDKEISVAFDQHSSTTTENLTWTWGPRMGNDSANGTYAITYIRDKNDKITGDNPVIVETGDAVSLSVSGTEMTRYFAGSSPEVPFIPNTGFRLVINDDMLVQHHAKLYVKNVSRFDYSVEVLGENGKKKYDATWDFPANDTSVNEQGNYLMVDTSDAPAYPGMIVRVAKKNKTVIYKGSLGNYPKAKYDFLNSTWRITAGE
jgi:hypothetical protein